MKVPQWEEVVEKLVDDMGSSRAILESLECNEQTAAQMRGRIALAKAILSMTDVPERLPPDDPGGLGDLI